jgi:hypothetical protein
MEHEMPNSAFTISSVRRRRSLAAISFAVLALGGCANIDRHQPTAQTQTDDDAYCRSTAGQQGSPAYAACLKDRDVAASRSDSRVERTHRGMAERMLNGQ